MKTGILLLALLVCAYVTIGQEREPDFLQLRNGVIYYGEIVEVKAGEFVRICVGDENIKTIPIGEVEELINASERKERKSHRKVLCEITRLNNYVHFNAELRSLKGDTLNVDLSGFEFAIPLESITKIKHKRRSHLGFGIAFGSLIGGAIGALYGYETSEDSYLFTREGAAMMSGCMGAAGGILAGAVIGLVAGKDSVYDLSNADNERKRFITEKLILNTQ